MTGGPIIPPPKPPTPPAAAPAPDAAAQAAENESRMKEGHEKSDVELRYEEYCNRAKQAYEKLMEKLQSDAEKLQQELANTTDEIRKTEIAKQLTEINEKIALETKMYESLQQSYQQSQVSKQAFKNNWEAVTSNLKNYHEEVAFSFHAANMIMDITGFFGSLTMVFMTDKLRGLDTEQAMKNAIAVARHQSEWLYQTSIATAKIYDKSVGTMGLGIITDFINAVGAVFLNNPNLASGLLEKSQQIASGAVDALQSSDSGLAKICGEVASKVRSVLNAGKSYAEAAKPPARQSSESEEAPAAGTGAPRARL